MRRANSQLAALYTRLAQVNRAIEALEHVQTLRERRKERLSMLPPGLVRDTLAIRYTA